jgi:hypothetical protein
METETCHILLPGGPGFSSYELETAECLLLREVHGQDHPCKLSDGRYIVWSSSDDCNEENCPDFPDCDCFDWREMSTAEAEEMLNAQLRGKTI